MRKLKSPVLLIALLLCHPLVAQNTIDEVLTQLEVQLKANQITASEILSEPKYDDLKTDTLYRPSFRRLLKNYPAIHTLLMVSENEPGEMLMIKGRLEKYSTTTLIYIFHTDNNGLYAPEHPRAGHGSNNPRLFGYVKPNEKGEFIVKTIVPACYPGGSLKHIHYSIINGNRSKEGELIFDEPPHAPSARQREWARTVGFKIVKRQWSEEEGAYVVEADF